MSASRVEQLGRARQMLSAVRMPTLRRALDLCEGFCEGAPDRPFFTLAPEFFEYARSREFTAGEVIAVSAISYLVFSTDGFSTWLS
jgi:hypothetical protein